MNSSIADGSDYPATPDDAFNHYLLVYHIKQKHLYTHCHKYRKRWGGGCVHCTLYIKAAKFQQSRMK